jgi:hypothetical protein
MKPQKPRSDMPIAQPISPNWTYKAPPNGIVFWLIWKGMASLCPTSKPIPLNGD